MNTKRASSQALWELYAAGLARGGAAARRGTALGVPRTEGVYREILKQRWPQWTFVRQAGVEPTNNAAERAIRPAVLWCKGSLGTQSSKGSRFVEVVTAVVVTLKQQHRNALDYLTVACEATWRGDPGPASN